MYNVCVWESMRMWGYTIFLSIYVWGDKNSYLRGVRLIAVRMSVHGWSNSFCRSQWHYWNVFYRTSRQGICDCSHCGARKYDILYYFSCGQGLTTSGLLFRKTFVVLKSLSSQPGIICTSCYHWRRTCIFHLMAYSMALSFKTQMCLARVVDWGLVVIKSGSWRGDSVAPTYFRTPSYLLSFVALTFASQAAVSVLQWPLNEQGGLPLHEHPASTSGVGLPFKIIFILGVLQEDKLRVCLENILLSIGTEEVFINLVH